MESISNKFITVTDLTIVFYLMIFNLSLVYLTIADGLCTEGRDLRRAPRKWNLWAGSWTSVLLIQSYLSPSSHQSLIIFLIISSKVIQINNKKFTSTCNSCCQTFLLNSHLLNMSLAFAPTATISKTNRYYSIKVTCNLFFTTVKIWNMKIKKKKNTARRSIRCSIICWEYCKIKTTFLQML